jgi:hypothetical protein
MTAIFASARFMSKPCTPFVLLRIGELSLPAWKSQSGTVRAKSVEAGRVENLRRGMTKRSPFRYFKTSPEIIRLAAMMYVRFPLSLRNVEDLLHERGIDISHETVRFWWNKFGPLIAAEIRKNRVARCAHIQIGSGTWMRCS